MQGGPIDVAPKERRRARRNLMAPDDPERSVSREEFDEMVRDISDEIEPQERPRRQRPPRRATAVEEPAPPPPTPQEDDAADARPEDVVMPDEERRDRPRRPRNRRHGRPR
jgi:SecD/SecF fusion protein